jgi:hypothetical protein
MMSISKPAVQWIYNVNDQDITPDHVDALFELIENHTGLDAPMAKSILHMGNPINHPSFVVKARRSKA